MLYLLAYCVNGQTNPGDGLLFKQFEKGVIKYRNNTQQEALLNYNTIEGEFLFLAEDNSIMALSQPKDVDIITIGRRYFVPSEKDAFYEMLKAGEVNFFVQWKSKLISQGKKSAYGGYSGSSAISNVTIHRSGGGGAIAGVGIYGRLIPDELFKANTDCIYFIVIDGKYKKFISLKTYLKLFRDKEDQIKNFVKEHDTNFDDPEAVCKLVKYTYSL